MKELRERKCWRLDMYESNWPEQTQHNTTQKHNPSQSYSVLDLFSAVNTYVIKHEPQLTGLYRPLYTLHKRIWLIKSSKYMSLCFWTTGITDAYEKIESKNITHPITRFETYTESLTSCSFKAGIKQKLWSLFSYCDVYQTYKTTSEIRKNMWKGFHFGFPKLLTGREKTFRGGRCLQIWWI